MLNITLKIFFCLQIHVKRLIDDSKLIVTYLNNYLLVNSCWFLFSVCIIFRNGLQYKQWLLKYSNLFPTILLVEMQFCLKTRIFYWFAYIQRVRLSTKTTRECRVKRGLGWSTNNTFLIYRRIVLIIMSTRQWFLCFVILIISN